MKKNETILLYSDDLGHTIRVKTPYSEAFIAELKDLIPFQDRNHNDEENPGRGWDKNNKTWGFASDYLDAVEDLLVDHFPRHLIQWETQSK